MSSEFSSTLAKNLALLEKVERIVLVKHKIGLLLNPAEADHREFLALIERVFRGLDSQGAPNIDAFKADIDRITLAAQAILKREWVRVKRGR